MADAAMQYRTDTQNALTAYDAAIAQVRADYAAAVNAAATARDNAILSAWQQLQAHQINQGQYNAAWHQAWANYNRAENTASAKAYADGAKAWSDRTQAFANALNDDSRSQTGAERARTKAKNTAEADRRQAYADAWAEYQKDLAACREKHKK